MKRWIVLTAVLLVAAVPVAVMAVPPDRGEPVVQEDVFSVLVATGDAFLEIPDTAMFPTDKIYDVEITDISIECDTGGQVIHKAQLGIRKINPINEEKQFYFLSPYATNFKLNLKSGLRIITTPGYPLRIRLTRNNPSANCTAIVSGVSKSGPVYWGNEL
jgi:hypothetical protein